MVYRNYKHKVTKVSKTADPKSVVSGMETSLYLRGNVENILNTIDHAKFPSDQKPNAFRTSALPYCPILDTAFQANQEKGVAGYDDNFYFAVGTVVHELLQASLTIGHDSSKATTWHPIGGWLCTNEDCRKQSGNLSKKPDTCKHCGGQHFVYQEAKFNYRGLTGHCDYIIYSKELGGYIVFEFKTAGQSKVKDGVGLPYPKHHHQAQCYSFNVQRLLKKWGSTEKVIAYAVIYVGRDGPWRYINFNSKVRNWKVYAYDWSSKLYKKTQERLDLAVEGRKAVKALIKDFNSDNLKALLELKPCASKKEYYKNGQHDAWGWGETCPYVEKGVCFSDKIGKRVKENIKVIISMDEKSSKVKHKK